MRVRGLMLFAIAALTLGVGTGVVLSAAPNEEATKAELKKQLQQLLQERVTTSERAVEALQAAFVAQTITLDVLLVAVNKLAGARLAAATTSEQKIDALEKRATVLTNLERRIRALHDAGARGGEAKELAMAERERQSAEIAWIEARLKALQ